MSAEIIIPSRARPDLLAGNLPSVLDEADRAGISVAVVFDGPPYELPPAATGRVRTVEAASACGYGAAVNRGVETSRADLVMLLNNDMRILSFGGLFVSWGPDEFARTASCRNLKAGGEDESPSRWIFDNGLLRVMHPCLSGEAAPVAGAPLAHAHGGASVFSRQKWRQLGGYSRLYSPAYGEDVDLSFRAWKRGWTVTFRPEAEIEHDSGATTDQLFSPVEREQLAERHRLLFHIADLSDPGLAGCRDRAFHRILSSGYLDFVHWRLKEPLRWALSRREMCLEHRDRIQAASVLSDMEALKRSGAVLGNCR